MKYSKGLAESLAEKIATGEHTLKDCCIQSGISESIFYKWKKDKVEFLEVLKKAEIKRLEAFKDMAVSGLAKLLDVFEYEEVTTEYVTDKDGKPKIKSRKVVKKKIMPNPTAVIFTLTNRDSKNWKHQAHLDKNITLKAKIENMEDDQLLKLAEMVIQNESENNN